MAKPDNAHWLWIQPVEMKQPDGSIKRSVTVSPPSPHKFAEKLLNEFIIQEALALFKADPDLIRTALLEKLTSECSASVSRDEKYKEWGQW